MLLILSLSRLCFQWQQLSTEHSAAGAGIKLLSGMELPNTEHFYDPQRDENLAGVFLGSSLELTVASLLSKKENVPDCKNSVFQNYLPFINSSP